MAADSKPRWNRPGIFALLAVLVVANFVVDYLVFQPESKWLLFITDVVLVGGTLLVVSRIRPPDQRRSNF